MKILVIDAVNLLFTIREVEGATCLLARHYDVLGRRVLPIAHLTRLHHDVLASVDIIRY